MIRRRRWSISCNWPPCRLTARGIKDHEMDASVRLAQLKVGQGKYEEAIPLLKRAQDIQPRDSVGRFLEDLERFMKTRR